MGGSNRSAAEIASLRHSVMTKDVRRRIALLSSRSICKYLLFGSALLAFANCGLANTIGIGYFDDNQSISVGPGSSGVTLTTSNGAASPHDIGDQREFSIRRTGPGGATFSVDSNVSNLSTLNFELPSNNSGRLLITWDGPENVASPWDPNSATDSVKRGQPDTFGLGDIDLTSNGSNSAVGFTASSDHVNAQLIFRVYRSATAYADAIYTLPGDDLLSTHLIFFNSFSAHGDTLTNIFRHANAITLEVVGNTNATDITIDNIVAQAPEPGTFVLLGGALVGAVAFARRRRAS
jgi:hypothetical protein